MEGTVNLFLNISRPAFQFQQTFNLNEWFWACSGNYQAWRSSLSPKVKKKRKAGGSQGWRKEKINRILVDSSSAPSSQAVFQASLSDLCRKAEKVLFLLVRNRKCCRGVIIQKLLLWWICQNRMYDEWSGIWVLNLLEVDTQDWDSVILTILLN